jgi:hypothetical protein
MAISSERGAHIMRIVYKVGIAAISLLFLMMLYALLQLTGAWRAGLFSNPTGTESYRQLVRLHSDLNVGMVRAEVESTLKDYEQHFRVRRFENRNLIVVVTEPPHFLSKNRTLRIQFDEEDSVSSLKIRLVDAPGSYDEGDPGDKVAL